MNNGDGTFVHVALDSKLGVEEADFTLRLEIEGEGKEREVRRFIYQGSGLPKRDGQSCCYRSHQQCPQSKRKGNRRPHGSVAPVRPKDQRTTGQETALVVRRGLFAGTLVLFAKLFAPCSPLEGK